LQLRSRHSPGHEIDGFRGVPSCDFRRYDPDVEVIQNAHYQISERIPINDPYLKHALVYVAAQHLLTTLHVVLSFKDQRVERYALQPLSHSALPSWWG
jgi:hypothetical protein